MALNFYKYYSRQIKYALHFNILNNSIIDAENKYINFQKPLKNVIVSDSMFIDTAYLLKIKKMIKSIKGVFWADFVLKKYYPLYSDYLKGKISNVGTDGKINYGEILNINPDMIFLIDWNIFNPLSKWLDKNNIPYTKTGNYKEPKFLGKMEWIKFYASFYNKYKKAEKVFNKIIEEKRRILKSLNSRSIKYKPVVAFFGYHKNQPYIYGKSHYIPNWIREIKGNYLFENVEGTNYHYIDRKIFNSRAKYADVCILDTMGEDIDIKELLKKQSSFFKV